MIAASSSGPRKPRFLSRTISILTSEPRTITVFPQEVPYEERFARPGSPSARSSCRRCGRRTDHSSRSLIECTISEPNLSSKTTAVGDPILCQVGLSERYGRSQLPFNSYLVGQFEDYRDPGHFVGKGWMELRFDRMVIEPDTVIPVDAKVVGVPGYVVDREGRIIGRGHAVRDTVEWMIPILWPIDMLTLPRRGPRPTLKGETRLTLKVMQDLAVPATAPPERDPSGLYRRTPSDYTPPPPQDEPSQAPQPTAMMPAPVPQVSVVYMAPPPVYVAAPPAPVWGYAPPPRTVVLYRNGMVYRIYVP